MFINFRIINCVRCKGDRFIPWRFSYCIMILPCGETEWEPWYNFWHYFLEEIEQENRTKQPHLVFWHKPSKPTAKSRFLKKRIQMITTKNRQYNRVFSFETDTKKCQFFPIILVIITSFCTKWLNHLEKTDTFSCQI